jgi:hypothetical protein
MNIFFLDNNPVDCARQHCDKHVIKMILEYAQLLSTAHRVLDGKQLIEQRNTNGKTRKIKVWKLESELDSVLYKATHSNHPSAVWVRESKQNYMWLANLLCYLCEEYTYRYGKTHKVEKTGLCYILLKNIPTNIPQFSITKCPLAMPDIYKIEGNIVDSYRNFYNKSKSRFATWKVRPTPLWFNPTCDK